MKKVSKILSVFLAFLMAFTVLPLAGIETAAAEADTYTVKYNSNGGSGSMMNSTFTVDTEQALRANGFARTGYTFQGWSTDRLATSATYTDGQTVTNLATAGSTVTLYAIWVPNTYTVKFDANGGEGTMADQTFTYDVRQTLTANTFTREGFTFQGWGKAKSSTTANYTDQQNVRNLTTTNYGVVTLYAVWKRIPATVTAISVEQEPTKTEYYVGETFNPSGLKVSVNMSNHTVNTITTGFTLSSPDMSTAGEKTVTVTYEGFTATFTINVVERPVYEYTFSINDPAVTEVANAESVVLSATIEGTYPDGMYVVWTPSNNNFAVTNNTDGTVTVVAEGSGSTVFTATLYTAEGEQVAQDTVELTALEKEEEPAKPGFFARIIAFFKNIFKAITGIFKK